MAHSELPHVRKGRIFVTRKRRKADAAERSARRGIQVLFGFLRVLLLVLLSAAAAAAVLFLVFRPVVMGDASMSGTLERGDVLLANRIRTYCADPKRGDLVSFSRNGKWMVKRVIALPGEWVEIVRGNVFIDSRPLTEEGYRTVPAGDMEKKYVPEGCYFVLGDDRTILADSRLEEVGLVRRQEVAAINGVRIYPLYRITLFG